MPKDIPPAPVASSRTGRRTAETTPSGAPRLYCLENDMNGQKRGVAQLRENEERCRLLAETCHAYLCELDDQGRLVYLNSACESSLGSPPDGLLGRSPLEFVHPEDAPRLAALLSGTYEHGRREEVEFRLRSGSGAWIWCDGTVCAYRNLAGQWRTVIASRDITERKTAEQRLAHRAFHDALTGLPNRALLLDRLDQVLKTARRNPGGHFAVLFLDLDRFKQINDSLGHAIGDEVLKTVGQALRECVREHDTVARLGGDEFAIILENLPLQREIVRVVKRINSRLSQRISIAGLDLVVQFSIGIVLSPEGQKPEDILRNADVAMYQAKTKGTGKFRVFTPRMRARAVKTTRLEHALRQAIEQNELEVHFQPIVELETGRLHGLEALARWRHPEHGLVPPAEFIPLAEDTGLILPLGRLVLGQACAQVSRWNSGLPPSAALTVHVNLSPRQFRDVRLIQVLEHALAEHSLEPRLLNLEFTEAALMDNIQNAESTLKLLKGAGVGLSLDDFGTGHASLGSLCRFPMGTLKIDRSFVAKLDQDHKTTALVQTIIALAKTLGMSVVAEGVETEEQAERLEGLGCAYAQGFHYSRPLSVQDMDGFLGAAAQRSQAIDVRAKRA